jgi:hypothetical protein
LASGVSDFTGVSDFAGGGWVSWPQAATEIESQKMHFIA